MKTPNSSKQRHYLLRSLAGFFLLALDIYSSINAYEIGDDFKLFMRIVAGILIGGYSLNYLVLFLKNRAWK
jgi:hypothetical protein